MKRRAYLAATAACLGGCLDRRTPERRTNGTADDAGPSPAVDPGRRADAEGDDETDDDPDPDPRPDAAGTIDDFEDLSRWTVLEGSLSADEERSLVGTQSGRLDATGEHGARIVREFADPIDLSAVIPGVGIASTDTVVPWVQAVDEDGNRVDFRRGVRGDLPLARTNFGVSDVVGDPDLARVTELRIVVWDRAEDGKDGDEAGDETGTAGDENDEGDRGHDGRGNDGKDGDGVRRSKATSVWCDDLHAVPRPETGKLMIQFDDAHVTDYTEALPILREHGFPAVTFVSTGYVDAGVVGGHRRLSSDQVAELHDAGWTIANHTVSHPNLAELPPDEQEAEIRRGKEWLEAHGYDVGARYFAYPFGGYDATTVELVEEYHELGYAGGFPVQGYTSAPSLASRIAEPSAKRARRVLDLTAEMRGITSIFYHRLEGDLLADFEAMVECAHERVADGDLEVILPEDVERRFCY